MENHGFECAECGGSRLEEYMTGVVVYTEVVGLSSDGHIELGDQDTSYDDADFEYRCMDCTWTIPNVFTQVELSEYLREKKWRD